MGSQESRQLGGLEKGQEQAGSGSAPRREGPPSFPQRRALLLEVLGLYLVTLMAIKGIVAVQSRLALPEWLLVLVPALFIYVPILWLDRKKLDSRAYGLVLEGVLPALKINLGLLVLVLLPFAVANHFYQGLVFGRAPMGRLPGNFLTQVVAYHLFFVALPEEFFYRGYIQSRLNEVFPRKWSLLGVRFGWSLFITALLFTVGHSLVVVRWWHFSIVFPALVFGLIRERSGNVLASGLFHAICNIVMVTLDTYYGVIPP